jgi:hypothetical protein
MDSERISGLGLEPMLTTSELAEYLGVQAQAIYDLRAAYEYWEGGMVASGSEAASGAYEVTYDELVQALLPDEAIDDSSPGRNRSSGKLSTAG